MNQHYAPRVYRSLLKKFSYVLTEEEQAVIERWTGLDGGVPTMRRATKELGIDMREACEVCISGITEMQNREALLKLYKSRERALERLQKLEVEISLLEGS